MRLFNLIKKDHGIGIPAYLFAELSALLISNISWRRTDHLGNTVFLHIFGHIYPDQGCFCTEHSLCQSLGKLCLSHTCRAKE